MKWNEKAKELTAPWLGYFPLNTDSVIQAISAALSDAYKAGMLDAAKLAFELVRCDDDTDRWRVANGVAARIRAAAEGEK